MDTTSEAEKRRRHRLVSLVDSYFSIRKLTEHELSAVQPAPPIRHIYPMWFVLYYAAVREGEHWGNDDPTDWHRTWFRRWGQANLWRPYPGKRTAQQLYRHGRRNAERFARITSILYTISWEAKPHFRLKQYYRLPTRASRHTTASAPVEVPGSARIRYAPTKVCSTGLQ